MCGTDDGTRRPWTMRARGTSATTTTTTRTSIDRSRRWRRCGALRASTRDDDGRDATARESDAEAFEEMVVLHESEAVVIVNKPRGMSFHSEFAPGALARLRTQMGERTAVMSVHRLDKPTSGILVFAKNARARDALSKAFEEREIVKYYVGMSNRKPRKKMGTVRGDMTRSRRKAWMLTSTTESPAETKFVSFGARGMGERALRMFVFRPMTGKTHQLRVAAKSLGSPLLGDDTYGGERDVDRTYLHACAIRIPKSVLGETIQIICSPIGTGDEWDPAAFDRYFPESLANDFGAWFDDQPLLRSTVDGDANEQ